MLRCLDAPESAENSHPATFLHLRMRDVPSSRRHAGAIALLCLFTLALPRAGLAQTAVNRSTATTCAEHDNVSVSLSGNIASFTVEATPPSYDVGVDNCSADFTNCAPSTDPTYPFSAAVYGLLNEDGDVVVDAVREASWWRPTGMTAWANDGSPSFDIHYLRIYKRIAGVNSWPQVLVLYADGNLRLIPHPSVGWGARCFGSSVIVGPAAPAIRPLAEIASVHYVSASKSLFVTYKAGGSAVLTLEAVDRTITRVRVTVTYPTDVAPFATFRSMYVTDGNADVDHVLWKDTGGILHDDPVMTVAGGDGREWKFRRALPSQHNRSAPDIRIAASFGLAIRKSGSGGGTITSSPAGINCGTQCATTYESGTSVILTPIPAPRSHFAGWAGDADCLDGIVTLGSVRSCFANFVGVRPFTDDPLTAGSTVIRAVHVTELRTRIDAVRARYGLGPYAYSNTPMIYASLIRASDVVEMRRALLEAYDKAGLPPPTYTDPTLGPGATVKVEHIAEVRAAVVALE